MTYLEKQKRDGKIHYYLAHTIRLNNNQFKKIRIYLKSSDKELSQTAQANLVLDNFEKLESKIDETYPELSTDYDWDLFFKNVDILYLSSELLQLEIIIKKFNKIKTNADYYDKLLEDYVILHAHNTTKVEGNTLTKKDTELLLTRGIISETKELREANEVLNISKAIEFIEIYDKAFNIDFICQVHKIVTQNTLKESRNEGTFRPSGVNVTMGGSDYSNVPGGPLIKKYLNKSIKGFNDTYQKDKLGAIVRFYASFIAIHPFIDGNGRTSRILLNWLLKKEGLPYVNYEAEDHLNHIEGIDKAIKGKGFNELADFIYDKIIHNKFT